MEFEALTPVERWGAVRRSAAMLLVFSFTFGGVLIPEAWATRYVDPATGSDAANDCSSAGSPCASITHALTQATPPEDIQCAAGTYTTSNGEVFPIAMVDQVQIMGAGAASTTIRAPNGTGIFYNDDTPLQSSTRLSGFTLTHAALNMSEKYIEFELDNATMAPQIDNCTFVGDGANSAQDDGIYFEDDGSGDGTFTGLIDNNTFVGMYAPVWGFMNYGGNDNFSPVISNNTFTDCDYPVSFTMSSSAEGTVGGQISDNVSTGTDDNDLYFDFGPDYSSGLVCNPTISGNTFGSASLSTGASSNVYIAVSFSSATGTTNFSPTFSGNTMTATGDNVDVAYMYLYNSGDFTFSPTFSNNTFTSLNDDNFYMTTMTVSSGHSGNVTVSPTFSNNTMTASNGSNIYFYSFDVSSVTGDFNFDPVVTDNPSMAAADYNFTIYYGYYSYLDGDASVSPTITGNTMTGAGTTGISIYYTTMSVSSTTQVNTFSPTITNNTINANGGDGIYIYLSDLEYGVFESDLTITGNTITGAAYGMEMTLEYFSDGHGFDAEWLISNNTITSPTSDGIYLEVSTMSLSASSGTWDLTISNNTVTDAGEDGMDLQPAYSWYSDAEIDQTILISGNTVTGSVADGIYMYLSDQTGLLSNDVRITDNVLQNNGDDGLDIESNDWNASSNFAGNAILVSGNLITGSGDNGVEQGDGNDPPADFGGGNLASPGNNTFTSNSAFDFYNEDDQDVYAMSNWWGTTNTAVIDANIYDVSDDGTKGEVLYGGYLTSAFTSTSFSAGSYTVLESDGSVTVTVNRTGDATGAVSVDYDTVDGSAAAGTDYTAASGTLSWADGDSAGKSFNVTILDNGDIDGTRYFTVELSNPQGGAGLGAPSAATVTINDDDAAAAAAIPTLGEWGLLLFVGLLLLAGLMLVRRRPVVAMMVLAALVVMPSAAGEGDKTERKSTHVSTLKMLSVDGGLMTLKLDDGTTITAPAKDLRYRDARNKVWRVDKGVRGDARKAARNDEAKKAERAAYREAKKALRASGKKNIHKEDVLGGELLGLKSLASGQPVFVTVHRDRDGEIRSVRVQAVKEVAEVQRMLAARDSAKKKRAAERAAKSR